MIVRATLVALIAGMGVAQTPVVVKVEKEEYRAQAKISSETAIATAQARFPTGTIKSAELEKEGRRLIYTFDIQLPGINGIEEVNVDALTGKIVGVEHEKPPTPKPVKPATTRPSSP